MKLRARNGKKWINVLLIGLLTAGCDETIPKPEKPQTSVVESAPASSNTSVTGANVNTAIQSNHAAGTQTQIGTPAQVAFIPQKEGQLAHDMDNPTGSVRQYLAYVPKGYNADPGKKWPLVVFLHGMGELGNNVNDIYWTYFAWKTIDKSYPYILITPQLLSGQQKWSAIDLNKLLDEVLPKYNIDYSKISLTGYSLGAHGVFDLAAYNPKRFAALLPVAGWGDTGRAAALKDMSVWAFHGDSDPSVNVSGSVNMINAIKDAGGTKANLTIYHGKGHDVHSITYDNPAVIEWLISQHR